MNIKIAKALRNKLSYLLFYSIAAVILFLPVLNKNFVSDDFIVLKRVCLEKTIWVKGFFRPISDCTIYVNYLLGSFNPFGFNLVNILIHSINSLLLFRFCLKWKWTSDEDLQRRYAFMASILFLTYPFHNEAIVWLLGRGSSMAATFAIVALLIFLSGWNHKAKLLGVCACYFIGLLAYESIVILPLLILILLREKKTASRTFITWITVFFITGFIYFLFRYNFSGAVFGTYGEDLFKTPWLNYFGNILKVTGRLLLPPIKNSRLFLVVSVITMFITVLIFFLTFIKLKKQIPDKLFVLRLLGIIASTLVVPFLFAVSTRTSESDRLLYIPSFFVCCFPSFLICRFIQSQKGARLIFVLLCTCNIIFLELNNNNWSKAGSATYSILRSLKSDTGNIFIANLPNEISGAYIFREGFRDALIVSKIDTSKVKVLNKLAKELVTNPDEVWVPVFHKTGIFIPPFLELTMDPQTGTLLKRSDTIFYKLPANNKLYYWDQHKFVLLKVPHAFAR